VDERARTTTASGRANEVAPAILAAFDEHQERFLEITRRARRRFDDRDWQGSVDDAAERLDLYPETIGAVERGIRATLAEAIADRDVWTGAKAVYSGSVADREDREIAETFFNSVTRRLFATVGVDANVEFVDPDVASEPARPRSPIRSVEREGATTSLVERIVREVLPGADFADLAADARLAAESIDRGLGSPPLVAELVPTPFFRRKGAYVVGRLRGGGQALAFALALLHEDDGVTLDAVLLGQNDLSVLFSFTRSHFHVDAGPPAALVAFLKELMPAKPVAELYISIGFHKHGKTELYRDLLHFLTTSDARFDTVPGTPGLVMVVFAMAGYDVVFKVIRDEFPVAKTVTRSSVMEKYRLVFRHDRAGRLVEAQEFEHLRFDRSRFAPALVEELERACGRHVAVDADAVVIHHAYVERRVTPLDVYVKRAPQAAREAAVVDFGRSIKDLAATNIFPGDLLPKNFGLTRHDRVVFYDYDELGMLEDFTFRDLPESTLEEEAFDEPWFGAAPYDVFPEEFPRFVGLPGDLLAVFETHHRDLYDAASWRAMQRRIADGEIVDIFPYHESRRLG
jgi:isocitrate dehydrogenase kinase/phosphatase